MTGRPAGEGVVFLDRPGYRVTAATVLIGGQAIGMSRVYTAAAREAPRGRVGRLLCRPLRLLTADGPMVMAVGGDAALAGELAAAINRAVAPGNRLSR